MKQEPLSIKDKGGLKPHKLDNYHKRALSIAENSPDKQTKVGAILINKESGAVLADGYNGFCRGCDDSKLPTTRPEKYQYMIHAETNLLYNCARHGISTRDCIVFCTLSPCVNCMRAMYQANIKNIYFKDKYRDFCGSVAMKDLNVEISKIGKYTRIVLKPRDYND